MGLFANQMIAKEMENKAKKLKTFWLNRDPPIPFVFCDVVGTENTTDAQFIDKVRIGQESLYNPEEANKIVRIISNYKCLLMYLFTCFRLKLLKFLL